MTGKYLLFLAVWLKAILGGYVYPIPAENLCQNANTGLFSPTDTFFVIAGGLKGPVRAVILRRKNCPLLRFPGHGLSGDHFAPRR